MNPESLPETAPTSSLPLEHRQPPLPQPEPPGEPERKRAEEEQTQGFRLFSFLREIYFRFFNDHAPLTAAALSFFTLLSFIPTLLLAVAAFGYFMDTQSAHDRVIRSVRDFLPALSGAPQVERQVEQFLSGAISEFKQGSGFTAILGLIGFLWAASNVFLNMEIAFNDMLGAVRNRGFLRARLQAIIMIFLTGALLLMTLGITHVTLIVKSWKIPLPPFITKGEFAPGKLPFIWEFLSFLVPVTLSFLMFFWIYKLVPNAKIRWKAAFVGALVATFFFELSKYGFGWYLAGFGRESFNKVYGTIGWMFILFTWTLFSYLIMLVGVEVADVYSDTFLHKSVVEEQSEE